MSIAEGKLKNDIVGVPHVSSEDDIYRGMFIPKGSLIFANIRSMGINTDVYKDPDTFNPYRYRPQDQGGNGEPLFSASFGFGARYTTFFCPPCITLSVW